MVSFTAKLEQFGEQGEKTGWTYIKVPSRIAQNLMPGQKRSFRVKGTLDSHSIIQVALVPMGEGNFILAVNASMRKIIKKQKGQSVKVTLEVDHSELKPPAELIACLKDEPAALKNFNALPKSHQHYFTRWISSAKTDITKSKRIAEAVSGLASGRSFAEVMRAMKKNREDLKIE
jgi:hypothetical protein